VILDGEPIELGVAPIFENVGTRRPSWDTFVPFWEVFEALGMEIELNDRRQTIIAINENTEIRILIDELKTYINGRPGRSIVMLEDGTVMVSIQLVRNVDDVFVRWNERTQSLIITTI
jgi:hypothetical protein